MADTTGLDLDLDSVQNSAMRLTATQQAEILHSTIEVFGPTATVSLFGSRADDSARGGDIDLFITADLDVETARRRKIRFLAILKRRIGDRRIDVVVRTPDTSEREIHRVAATDGVPIQ